MDVPGAGSERRALPSGSGTLEGQSRSMIVTLAWPPPSHIVCRP